MWICLFCSPDVETESREYPMKILPILPTSVKQIYIFNVYIIRHNIVGGWYKKDYKVAFKLIKLQLESLCFLPMLEVKVERITKKVITKISKNNIKLNYYF